jgi:putative hydrolase of the HAD superfamily
MFRGILFDLDDTLYEERHFFRSGFQAVARALVDRGFGPKDRALELLEQFHHHEGRDRVLQKLSAELKFPPEWIDGLVEIFRSHKPDIELAADAREVLGRLRKRYKLGCVTDGWAAVQRAKLLALGAESLLDAIVVADDYGRDKWKPSPFPFHKCCELLELSPDSCLFVGDNPQRDIRGARMAGLRCVRLRRSASYFDAMDAAADESPDLEVTTLSELEQKLDELESTTFPK